MEKKEYWRTTEPYIVKQQGRTKAKSIVKTDSNFLLNKQM